MKRVSIRWVILGVATSALALPLLAFLSLRLLDHHLVQQTEQQLTSESAVIAESYRLVWSRVHERTPGEPRPPGRVRDTFVVEPPEIGRRSELVEPLPKEFPVREGALVSPAYNELSRQLRNAQLVTLSGVRVLDETGCVVASSRAQLDLCFSELAEVKSALGGRRKAVVRARVSDEPAPRFGSMSRRGDVRVFLARPVFDDGRVIGVVFSSRTSESALEFLFKNRRPVFFGGVALFGVLLAITFAFARFIIAPLERMAEAAGALGERNRGSRLAELSAPREIHELGKRFDEMAARIRERADYVREFAEQVSHELKTPLTSIRGALELLRESPTMSAPQRERFLSNMESATARTHRLVERLLLLARVENPDSLEGENDKVDAAEWVARFREGVPPEVSIEVDGEARPRRSVVELESVFSNAIDNALRYRRVEPVRVNVSFAPSHIEVVVRDDGPKIPEENLARLSERFFTTERDRGGTGLGLSILRAIAERRGGSLSISSGEEGTTVKVAF